MGFLRGFFGGSDAETEIRPFNVLQKLPRPFRSKGESVLGGALGFFQEAGKRGETAEERQLFAASRNDTVRRFLDAAELGQQNLHRLGAGSSTAARKNFGQIAEGLLSSLALQDVQRAERLYQQRSAANVQGANLVSGIAGGTTLYEHTTGPSTANLAGNFVGGLVQGDAQSGFQGSAGIAKGIASLFGG